MSRLTQLFVLQPVIRVTGGSDGIRQELGLVPAVMFEKWTLTLFLITAGKKLGGILFGPHTLRRRNLRLQKGKD